MLTCTYRDGAPPVNLAAAPMTHTAGLLSLPCTAQGGTVVICRGLIRLLVQAIGRHRVTEFFLPPTVIYALLEAPGIEKVDFSSRRYLLYGAAPMSVEKLKKAIALWGPVLTGPTARPRRWARHRHLRADEHMVEGSLPATRASSSVGRPNPLIRVEIMNDAGTGSCHAARPARSACAAIWS
jgi:acyl-CoA synthetase (AMP-forming)/AMP-acid ligase II